MAKLPALEKLPMAMYIGNLSSRNVTFIDGKYAV
jgi:hypothetical protein